MTRRIVQTAAPYFREKRDYNTIEGRIYLSFVLHEQRLQNIVRGYTLTRLSPLDPEDKEGFDYLKRMLYYIDPCIQLSESTNMDSSIAEFEKFYVDFFGQPGTPEFEQKLKEFNEQFK